MEQLTDQSSFIYQILKEKSSLSKQLSRKELELKDLLTSVDDVNSEKVDFDKLYDKAQLKAELTQLVQEKDELEIKLHEVEGAHHLLEGT